jgi:hypothetical protein
MPFVRHLDPAFVESLNEYHKDNGSWWHELANDPEVFLAVRNNAVNAYVNGGSIGRICWDGKAIALRVNHAYLVFPVRATKDHYVDLLNPVNPPTPLTVTNAEDFTKRLRPIKEIVGTYFGKERQGENEIAARLSAVIDIEAAFNTSLESSEPEFENDNLRQGRIDLVTVAGDGCLVFTEAKLFKNRELTSSRVPAVCDQLILYHQWIKKHAGEIQTAYCNLLDCHQDLEGKFFRRRVGQVINRVDPIPRLLVFGYDGHQEKAARAIKKFVCEGLAGAIPSFGTDHVRTVGSAKRVKAHHLV